MHRLLTGLLLALLCPLLLASSAIEVREFNSEVQEIRYRELIR